MELSTIGTALSALKTIVEIAKHQKNTELTQKIIELQNALLEMQQESTERLDEVRSLKLQIEELQMESFTKRDLEFVEDGGYYIKISERSAGQNVRYCAVCWGEKSQLVPLSRVGDPGTYYCVPHKNYFRTSEYVAWSAQRPVRAPRRSSPWM